MAGSVPIWKNYGFPKVILYFLRGSCFNTPQLIYNNVGNKQRMKFDINKDDFKKLIENSKKEKAELGKIIYPIVEKYKLEKKELLGV